MEIKEVFYILDGERKQKEEQTAIEDNRLRTVCFYTIAPYWDSKKNGKLRDPRQLWEIPLIDSQRKNYKMTKVIKLKPGEKPFENIIKRRNKKYGRQQAGNETTKELSK